MSVVMTLERRRTCRTRLTCPTGPTGGTAGRKKLAVLRAVMVDAGPVASRVIDALTDGRGSSAMVADGTLTVSPALCDALIELFTLCAHRGPEAA